MEKGIEHYREKLNLLVEDNSLYAQIPFRTRTRDGQGETSVMALNSNYVSVVIRAKVGRS